MSVVAASENNTAAPLSTQGPLSSAGFDDISGPTSTRGPLSQRYQTDASALSSRAVSQDANTFGPSSSKFFAQDSDDLIGSGVSQQQLPSQNSSVTRRGTAPSSGSPDGSPTSRQSRSQQPPLSDPHVVAAAMRNESFPTQGLPFSSKHEPVSASPSQWTDIFQQAQLSEDVAQLYAESFSQNEMPPPTRLDVLQYGIDNEMLKSLDVRVAGHRAAIIAVCRKLAAARQQGVHPRYDEPSSDHQGAFQSRSGNHHVHFARHSSKEASEEDEDQRRIFPGICAGNEKLFSGDDIFETGSGLDGVGEHAQSVGASFTSEAAQHLHGNDNGTGGECNHHSGSGYRHLPHHHINASDDDDATPHSHALQNPLLRDSESSSSYRRTASSMRDRRGSTTRKPSTITVPPQQVSYSHSGVQRRDAVLLGAVVTEDNTVHQFEFRSTGKNPYVWVDLVGRDARRFQFRDHLKHIVYDFQFAEQLLLDIDLTLALPQLISCPNEPDQFLIILRVAAESSGGIEEDSLHLLTHRVMIAVNLRSRAVITIHRRDSTQMAIMREQWSSTLADKSMTTLLCHLLDDSLLSYVDAIHDSESLLDEYEALMLKHSVGGSSSSHTAQKNRSALGANGSFNGQRKWSLSKFLATIGFGESDESDGRLRSGTVYGSLGSSGAGAAAPHATARLRNKEYQEDMLDSNSFTRQRMNQLLYHLHRRCSVYNRMLTLTQTTLEVSYSTLRLANPEYAEQVGRSCGELAMKAETLHDNCQNLLNLHLSLVSFRTNELMNLLTVYSAVFIPITFVCSVYGMNFVNMPELYFHNGYYYCLGVMGLMVLLVLLWFHKKGFL